MSVIASNIIRYMNEKGLKQKAVAKMAGFDEVKFSNMLNGRTVIRAEHIPPICEALGVEPNDIMKEEAQHGKQ